MINLNGLVFSGDSPADYMLNPPVSGLLTPPIRTSQGNYSGLDDGYVSSQFYAPREIVMNASIMKSCTDAEALLCQLQESLPIRQSLPFIFTSRSGKNYYADVYFINMELDITNYRFYEFQITLVAPDPNFYDIGDVADPDSGWIEQPIYKTIGGGYVTPYVLPVEWSPGQTPATVVNNGSIWVYPQIILEGKWTNPRITNVTTGQFVELDIATNTGDTIIIDMKERTVTLNGYSVLPYRNPDSSWWYLDLGDNTIDITSDAGDDSQEGIVRYRQAYRGVFEGVC